MAGNVGELHALCPQDKSRYGRVAVILGGHSAERDISLKTGHAVLGALQSIGIDAVAIDPAVEAAALCTRLQTMDRAFIALHGAGGEDGRMQGCLEVLGLPYTGSGILASALAMDKGRSKQFWQSAGLNTPVFKRLSQQNDPASTEALLRGDQAALAALVNTIGFPLIVKPVSEGSSIGMSKVESVDKLPAALQVAFAAEEQILVEQWVEGREFTVGVLAGQTLPVVELQTPHAFYDYDAKYLADSTNYICPAQLDDKATTALQLLSLQAFNSLACRGWGRVDVMQDGLGEFWLLEVNTIPGLTERSLVPMAAKYAGLSFEQLVEVILAQTLNGLTP